VEKIYAVNLRIFFFLEGSSEPERREELIRVLRVPERFIRTSRRRRFTE